MKIHIRTNQPINPLFIGLTALPQKWRRAASLTRGVGAWQRNWNGCGSFGTTGPDRKIGSLAQFDGTECSAPLEHELNLAKG